MSEKILLVIFTVLLLITISDIVYHFGLYEYCNLKYSVDIDSGTLVEDRNVAAEFLIKKGVSPYTDFIHYPLITLFHNPLYHFVNSFFVDNKEPNFFAGRFVSAISCILTMFFIGFIFFKITGRYLLSFFSLLVVIFYVCDAPSSEGWIGIPCNFVFLHNYPDMFSIMLSLLGCLVLCFGCKEKNDRRFKNYFYVSSFFFITSFFGKQYYFSAVTASFIFAFFYFKSIKEKFRFLLFLIIVFLFYVTFFYLMFGFPYLSMSFGMIFKIFCGKSIRSAQFDFPFMFKSFLIYFSKDRYFLIMIASALLFVLFSVSKKVHRQRIVDPSSRILTFMKIYFLTSSIPIWIFLSKKGSACSPKYLMEFYILCSIIGCVGLWRLILKIKKCIKINMVFPEFMVILIILYISGKAKNIEFKKPAEIYNLFEIKTDVFNKEKKDFVEYLEALEGTVILDTKPLYQIHHTKSDPKYVSEQLLYRILDEILRIRYLSDNAEIYSDLENKKIDYVISFHEFELEKIGEYLNKYYKILEVLEFDEFYWSHIATVYVPREKNISPKSTDIVYNTENLTIEKKKYKTVFSIKFGDYLHTTKYSNDIYDIQIVFPEKQYCIRTNEFFPNNSNIEYIGRYFFSEDEFDSEDTPKKLFNIIHKDFPMLSFTSQEDALTILNEILEKPAFYNVWITPRNGNGLTSEIKSLAEEIESYNSNKSQDLSFILREKIRLLNRLLMETAYPEICPKIKKYNKNEPIEIFFKCRKDGNLTFYYSPRIHNDLQKENYVRLYIGEAAGKEDLLHEIVSDGSGAWTPVGVSKFKDIYFKKDQMITLRIYAYGQAQFYEHYPYRYFSIEIDNRWLS